jgi:NADH-quinone oxidoreductase subunit G
MDVALNLRTVEQARLELLRLAPGTARPAAPAVPATAPAEPGTGEALLATWHQIIDAGRMQDGDEHLAGTAKPVRAAVNAKTAHALGVDNGQLISVSTERGTITAPVAITEMPDDVVWLPTNARGCPVRSILGAQPGSVVKIAKAGPEATVGAVPSDFELEILPFDAEGDSHAEDGGGDEA